MAFGDDKRKPATMNPQRQDAVPVLLYLTEFQAEHLFKTMEGGAQSYKSNQSRQVQRRAATAENVEKAFGEVNELVAGIAEQMPRSVKRRNGIK